MAATASATNVEPDVTGTGGVFTVANAALGSGFTTVALRTTSPNQTAVITSHDRNPRDKNGALYTAPTVSN